MPLTDPKTCEPMRIWSRLEPRARRVEFDEALEARVHDPLWMLARQWQFGEFKGEDTGSAILAKLASRTSAITAVGVANGPLADYDAARPLEARVERLPIDFPPVVRALAGRHFLARLDDFATSLPETATPYDPAHYRALFRRHFALAVEPLDPSDPGDAVAMARRKSTAAAHRMLLALAGRTVDGVALFEALPPDLTWSDLPGTLVIEVLPGHGEVVLAALRAYRAWFADLYATAPADGTAWEPAQLEYRFTSAVPRDNGARLLLTVDEYASGRLDWYSFDLGPVEVGETSAAGEVEVRTVIPAPAEFAGMPNPRWWQFEDGSVDLGNIRADSTDLAKVIVAEFALLYGNNWFVVPWAQRVGTLAELMGIVITDVFGWKTHVKAATGSSGGVWSRWDFFSLAPRGTVSGVQPLGQHLLLAPALGHVLESEPLESVAFVRDETTNTVWAVEARLPDGLGAGRDAAAIEREFRAALQRLEESFAGNGIGEPASPSAVALRYRLGTSVAENWIPFVPVHKPQETREIRLQRAAMPRFLLGSTAPVRPRTSILRYGLRPDDTQAQPYYVNEEEVPRAGVVVDGSMQRARWLRGSTVVWHGRRKHSGRGEGGSGLRFDVVEPPAGPPSG